MKHFGFALALLCAPLAAHAQVIDQQQPNGAVLFAQLGTWQAQTFTAGASSIVGGGFNLYATGGLLSEGAVEVRLYSAAASAGGQLLASAQAQYSIQGGTRAWVDAMWSSVAITSGGTYWLYLIGLGAAPIDPVYSTAAVNGYGGGNAWVGSTATATDALSSNWAPYDLSFRTFAPSTDPGEEPPPPSTTVPEPSTYALMVSGLAALAVLRRRRVR